MRTRRRRPASLKVPAAPGRHQPRGGPRAQWAPHRHGWGVHRRAGCRDRVRSAWYDWGYGPHRVTRTPAPALGEKPSVAWVQQQESDAYWKRVSQPFPRPAAAVPKAASA